MSLFRTGVAMLLAAAAASAQGRTWIVDAAGGPGAHFTDIPPAVAAAADGDTILIRTGNYSAFATGKALTMLGEGTVKVYPPAAFPMWPFPTAISIQGLPAGKTFVAKNIDVEFSQWNDGIAITNNQGRIHMEDVSARLVQIPAQDGTACRISLSTLVTWTGGALHGRPAVHAGATVASFDSMSITGDSACGGALCASWGAGIGMSILNARIWLSRTTVTGGSGSFLPTSGTGMFAIFSTDSALIVTGDGTTRLAAGGSATGSGVPAISTSGGSVDIDSAVQVIGSRGAPGIAGTALVVRRRIVSLAASGGPPGGTLAVSVRSPAGDPVHLVASLPSDPNLHPGGTVFINPLVILPLFVGFQGATGETALGLAIPNVAALRGAAIALQAGNFYLATSRFELSNPAVVVLH